MATYGDETFMAEAEACKAPDKPHPCTCDDLSCPLNPNNPRNRERGRGCDACIRKNIKMREVPSCLFNEVGPTPEGWDDYSFTGFVRHCRNYGIE